MNAVQVSTRYKSFVDGSKPISASVKFPYAVVGKLCTQYYPQCVSLAILHQVFHGHTHRDQSLVAMRCYHINRPRTAEMEHRVVLTCKHRRGCTKKEVSPRHHASSGTSVARTNEAEPRNHPRWPKLECVLRPISSWYDPLITSSPRRSDAEFFAVPQPPLEERAESLCGVYSPVPRRRTGLGKLPPSCVTFILRDKASCVRTLWTIWNRKLVLGWRAKGNSC
jgi:hypothetical protein